MNECKNGGRVVKLKFTQKKICLSEAINIRFKMNRLWVITEISRFNTTKKTVFGAPAVILIFMDDFFFSKYTKYENINMAIL